MAQPIRTKLSAILPLMQQAAMSALKLGTEAVIFGISGAPLKRPSLQGDNVVLIRPRSQLSERNIVGGAGRIDYRVVRKVDVVYWSRVDVDVEDQAQAWLLDAVLGHLDQEHALLDAFALFHPTDQQGNWLVFEPCRIGVVTDPVADEPGWGHSELSLDVPFIAAMSNALDPTK